MIVCICILYVELEYMYACTTCTLRELKFCRNGLRLIFTILLARTRSSYCKFACDVQVVKVHSHIGISAREHNNATIFLAKEIPSQTSYELAGVSAGNNCSTSVVSGKAWAGGSQGRGMRASLASLSLSLAAATLSARVLSCRSSRRTPLSIMPLERWACSAISGAGFRRFSLIALMTSGS